MDTFALNLCDEGPTDDKAEFGFSFGGSVHGFVTRGKIFDIPYLWDH